MKKNHCLLPILFSLFFLVPTAYAAWLISGLTIEEAVNESNLQPICYINTNEKGNQYYAIETALNKANSGDTIYVIPKTNPVIKYNCTIKSGVTLTLGGLTRIENNVRKYLYLNSEGKYTYEDTGAYAYKDRGVENESDASSNENTPENRGPHISLNYFADSQADYYCQNRITLNAALTINAGGTLNIAGRLGSEGWGLSGATTGDYCEIVMNSGVASIQNSGTIDCCGFIKIKDQNASQAQLNCLTGSKVFAPFIICDFNGGAYSAACNQKNSQKVIPFNQWLVCNIQTRQIYHYGSSLTGYYDAYNSSYMSKLGITIKKGHKTGNVNLIASSNSVITLLKSGKVTINTSTDDYSKTVITNGIVNKKMKIRFEGRSEIGKMIIPNPMPGLSKLSFFTNVEIDDVDTSNFFFSVNHYYDFEIWGSVNVTTSQKILPGSNVTVMNGGVLDINAPTIFVENLDETANGATKANKYPTIYNQSANPNELRNALINNGTVNVSSNGSLAGKIYSSNLDSTLNLNEAKALNISYKEAAKGEMDTPNFNLTYQNNDISANANGPLLTGSGVAVSDLSKKIYIYTAEDNANGWKEATNLDSYTITYHLNGGTADVKDGETKTSYLKQGMTKTIYSASIADPTKKYFVFDGWYRDSNLSLPLKAGYEVKNGTHLDLYAKYSYERYTVEYSIENQSGIEDVIITNPNEKFVSFTQKDLSAVGSFVIEEATSNKPNQIMFDGWYTSQDYSAASKLDGNLISECKSYVLYARFIKIRPKVTIDDPYFVGITNTFTVGEDGKLPSDVIGSINQRLSEIRTDSDKAQYVNGYKDGDISITLDELKNYVFNANTTLTLSKGDKYYVSYVFDSNIIEKKYYTRNSTNIVEGNPVLSDATIHDNNDRHFYKWKLNNDKNNSFENQDSESNVVSWLNNNKNNNNLSINVWWAYHLIVNVDSLGTKNGQITCPYLWKGSKEFGTAGKNLINDYVPTEEKISVNIPRYDAWSWNSATRVNSTNNFIKGDNKGGINSYNSGDKQFPAYPLTITFSKA